MKNRFLLLIFSLVVSSSLSASSITLNDNDSDKFYTDFNKHIEQFFNDRHFFNPRFDTVFSSYPKMDMIENEDSYTLKFELAGMKKENIKVTISQENVLVVSGVRNEYTKEDKDGVIKQERHFGSFKRAVTLPKNIKKDKIDVSYKDGILSIKIAKDINKVHQSSVKVLPIN